VSSQTPTIIIRLTSLSIRSQAVSTRDMRSGAAGILVSWGERSRVRATMLGKIIGVNPRVSLTLEQEPPCPI
jgi:hypothetical protein